VDHGVDPARIEGDVQRHLAHRRLRQFLIFEIFLLVIGLELLAVAARPILVEDVGIVEDPDSGRDEGDEGDPADDTGAAASQVLGAAGQLASQSRDLAGQVNRFLAEVRAA